MSIRLAAFVLSVLLGACRAGTDACSAPVRVADLPAPLDEASGVAVSRTPNGPVWVHNDSEGTAMLYALDRAGSPVAEIALPEAGAQFDWEDIAIGPCPDGDCIYIGDIGDNLHRRDDRAILRLAEPRVDAPDRAIAVERFPVRYPDGPVDAEALFVAPDTTVYVLTKGRRGPVTLYRYPPPLRAGVRVTLERVQRLTDGIAQLPDLVTGADMSVDGRRVAVRTYTHVQLYRWVGDSLAPLLDPPGVDISALREPQGEGIAFAGMDTLVLVTEAGPARVQPFLSRMTCHGL